MYRIKEMANQTTYIITSRFNFSTNIANLTISTPSSNNNSPDDASQDPTYISIRQLQKYVIPVLCIVGLFGNLTSVRIFMGRSLKKKSCCMYLMTKCLTDTFFLAALFLVWLDRININWFHRHGVCQMIVFLTYVCGFLSVWLVVMVTVENYIRIRHPHQVRTLCTPGKARVVLLVLGVTSIFCYNFPLWTTHSIMSMNSSVCSPVPEFSRFNEGLTYFDTAVTLVIPSVLVICFMCGIFSSLLSAYRRNKRMKKLGRQRHVHFFCLSPYGRVTTMLLAVSVTFIALHTPSHAIRLRLLVAQFMDIKPSLYLHELGLQRLFELLYYSNFATNCVTYFIFGKTFRELYKRLYCFCCCKRKKKNTDPSAQESACTTNTSASRLLENRRIIGNVTNTDMAITDVIMLKQN